MPRKPRVARSPAELIAETKVVAYEFVQLCESADLLRKRTFGDKGVSHNNTVQGFATAFRNLSCFLFPHDGKFRPLSGDDLGAGDYATDWVRHAPAPTPMLCDCKDAANKQVMHITGARRDLNSVPGKEFNWPIDDLERELLEALRIFLAAVPETLFDPAALADLRHLAARVPVAPGGTIPHSGHISVGSAGVKIASATTDVRTVTVHPASCAKTCP